MLNVIAQEAIQRTGFAVLTVDGITSERTSPKFASDTVHSRKFSNLEVTKYSLSLATPRSEDQRYPLDRPNTDIVPHKTVLP
jgi:hypothetical protein